MQRGVIDALVQPEVVDTDAKRASPTMLGRFMPNTIEHDGSGRRRHGAPSRRMGWFIAVGCGAAAVHWAVVVWLVGQWGWRPLLANGPGWLIAYTVSFAGHHGLTFRGHGAPLGSAALRFFAVSAFGFAINEVAYALLLHWSAQRYDLVLAVVLVAVAVVTYLLSRHWAFLRRPAN
jgi:putative flippase GtrA